MKKLVVAMLLATMIACAGCGSSTDSTSAESSFNVDVEKYKNDGYTAVSDIAYVKIDGKMVTFVFLKDNPAESLCLLRDVMFDLKDYDQTII